MPIFSSLSPEEELLKEFRLRRIQLTGEVIEKALDDHGESLYKIGEMYYNKKNYEKAVYWYLRSAAKNTPDAQFKLGYMYENGQGVTRSRRTAMEWYLKADGNDFLKGTHAIGAIHYKGSIFSFSRKFSEAIKWFKKAAEKEHPPSLYQVGLCYEKGHGVKKNKQEALEWYTRGDSLGDMNARNGRVRLSAKGYCLNDLQKRFIKAKEDLKEEERKLKAERDLQTVETLASIMNRTARIRRVRDGHFTDTNLAFSLNDDHSITISYAN